MQYHGMIADDLRRKIWPLLLGVDPDPSEKAPLLSELSHHSEYNQVVLDVNRSLKRFPPGMYVCNVKCIVTSFCSYFTVRHSIQAEVSATRPADRSNPAGHNETSPSSLLPSERQLSCSSSNSIGFCVKL